MGSKVKIHSCTDACMNSNQGVRPDEGATVLHTWGCTWEDMFVYNFKGCGADVGSQVDM